jgi:hypothetical protein
MEKFEVLYFVNDVFYPVFFSLDSGMLVVEYVEAIDGKVPEMYELSAGF